MQSLLFREQRYKKTFDYMKMSVAQSHNEQQFVLLIQIFDNIGTPIDVWFFNDIKSFFCIPLKGNVSSFIRLHVAV